MNIDRVQKELQQLSTWTTTTLAYARKCTVTTRWERKLGKNLV